MLVVGRRKQYLEQTTASWYQVVFCAMHATCFMQCTKHVLHITLTHDVFHAQHKEGSCSVKNLDYKKQTGTKNQSTNRCCHLGPNVCNISRGSKISSLPGV